MGWPFLTRHECRAYNRFAENGHEWPSINGAAPSVGHRRWFQYSLRSLMLFTLLCALLCSWFAVKMEKARKQRQAVAVIEDTDNTVCWQS
jgi:hypothetical protein